MKNKSSTNKILIFIALILVLTEMCAIFFLSSQTADESTVISGGLTQVFIDMFYPDFDSFDAEKQEDVRFLAVNLVRKTAHFTEYAILGFTLCWFWWLASRRTRTGQVGSREPDSSRDPNHGQGSNPRTTPGRPTASDPNPGQAGNREPTPGRAPAREASPARPNRFRTRPPALAWAVGTLYAVSDEIHQIYVPGRAGRLSDVLIDSAGAAAGALVLLIVLWSIKELLRDKRII